MTKRTKFAAIAATAFTALALSAAPASAVPDPGSGYGPGPYPSPNPAVWDSEISPAWYCFQYGPGPAPGASNLHYKVWCPKDVMPGTIYGNDGVAYGEWEWTTCGNGYPVDHFLNNWSCNAVWKSYPYPVAFDGH